MRLPSGGYTILEVMIFLAVSGLLLVAAIVAIGGQQAHTEFKTSVNDVNTKFQQWIDEVSNGFSNTTATAAGSGFTCQASGTYPTLTATRSGNQRGGNADCIFLGKAIQVNDDPAGDNNHIYAYTVIGDRADAAGNLVGDLVSAHPTDAVTPDSPNGPLDLIESYKIPNGARIKWVRDGPSITNLNPLPGSKLAGIYSSFNTGGQSTLQNGSQSLVSVQYPFTTNVASRSNSIANCIKMLPGGCDPFGRSTTDPWPMNQWVVCLESTRNSDTAAINLVSSDGRGVGTKITVPCPGE